MTCITPTTKRFTLDEIDALDVMSPKEDVALMMMDCPELLWDACLHYLNFRPDRWEEIARNFYKNYN